MMPTPSWASLASFVLSLVTVVLVPLAGYIIRSEIHRDRATVSDEITKAILAHDESLGAHASILVDHIRRDEHDALLQEVAALRIDLSRLTVTLGRIEGFCSAMHKKVFRDEG